MYVLNVCIECMYVFMYLLYVLYVCMYACMYVYVNEWRSDRVLVRLGYVCMYVLNICMY